MENDYPPGVLLQGCCLDCLIHNYNLSKVGSLQIKKRCLERGEAASSADLIWLMEADWIYT